MADTTKLLIEVASDKAKEILSKVNAEIALRDSRKKFSALYKCKVSEAPAETAEAMEKALQAFADKTTTSIEGVRKTVTRIERNSKVITDSVKDIALNVDKLTNITKITQGLSFLNAGMSMANLAVNVAGFAMVSKKLTEISSQIMEIDTAIQKQAERDKVDKVNNGKELIMTYIDMSDDWKSEKEVPIDREQKLLRQMTSYISGITDYLKKGLLDTELCMEIIMNLLPAYTILITEYLKHYFFDRKIIPTNLDSFKVVYREFLNPDLRALLIDYFFIEKEVGYNEALDDTNIVTLLALNDLTTIEDQVELLEMAGSEEDYKEVDRELERLAQMQFDEMMASVA